MDYEELLFGLQPIINADPINTIPIQEVYLESYLTVLDQLAVSLRAPNNRDVVGHTGLLSNLLRVLNGILDICFHNDYQNLPWFKLASELIRCIANSLIDNNTNREITMGNVANKNEILDYYIGRILKLTSLGDDETILEQLQMRSIVLVKNLCLESNEYTLKLSKTLKGPLLSFLGVSQHVYLNDPDSAVLATELFNEFVQVNCDGIKIEELRFLSLFIERVSKTIENIVIDEDVESTEIVTNSTEKEEKEEIEDDPSVDIQMNLIMAAEAIVSKNYTLDFTSNTTETTNIQLSLFNALEILSVKEFHNKLIIMRRIVSTIGHISANNTNSNRNEQEICIDILKNSQFGYKLAAASIVLSNSINCKEDANILSKQLEISDVIPIGKYFRDPMQFQGYLDLLKKLLNLSSAMFITKDEMKDLSTVIKICHDQTKYFSSLSPLLDNLINKFLVTVPSSTIKNIVNDPNDSLFLDVIIERGGILVCLLLDKLLVTRDSISEDILDKLFKSAFQFQDSSVASSQEGAGVSMSFLFHISKTIGIYLRNCAQDKINNNIIFTNHIDKFLVLMETLLSLKDKTDRASESCFNNGKFVSGMSIELLKNIDVLTIDETKLYDISKEYFS
ncbi:hypothetical protein Kpol_1072p9 [Vanderwaltozyma polyspora DSM 70294]|uniref:SWI5-dependent HO expression protein 4 n=1 Tax=Vanderwaltozyma polyspora (strain ATCC 22028 / DSM 70294 / BCRC 21397 / CBS 2163 / NBRC 10782 / NRRL Y-8283 / UCD 57-17) TaxID=436907 RepID=A7TKM7_VANPO|nr:uncharacterized protein Kpol_1072p9 [Vanderwaltozyma polyspora DSM 70294]EDO17139.1 hypothetical protein Kpol_1072p9 [Vanderwaltozyma polyspora DSM 70294]